MKKRASRLLSILLALCMALALLPGTAWAAEDALKDYRVFSTVQWSYPTITGGTVTQDTYSGKTQVLIFFRANGKCVNSNSTIRSLANADWISSDGVQVIAVGCGDRGEDLQTVKEHTISFSKEYASNCEDIEFCYATYGPLPLEGQFWTAHGQLQSLIGGDAHSIFYAANYIFDDENYLRFSWQGGYISANYTDALTALDGETESTPTPTPTPDQDDLDPVPDQSGSGSGDYQIRFDGTYDYDSAYAVLDSLNSYRQANGLSTLVMDKDLLATGMQRAAEIAIYFSHTRPDGSACFSIFPSKFTSGNIRENIAAGAASADAVMTGWKNSSGHNANMLAENNSSVGIGAFVDSDGTRYWVQVFTSAQGNAEASRTSGTRAVTANVMVSSEMLDIGVSSGSATLREGETVTLTAFNINTEWGYSTPGIYLTYAESKAPNVATVSIGKDGKAVVTAVRSGTTTLKLGVKDSGTSALKTVDVPITVKPAMTEDEHHFSNAWSSDATNHWHACTDPGCKEKSDEAKHTWDAGKVTVEPTSNKAGTRTYTCTVCKYTKTESIPSTGGSNAGTGSGTSINTGNTAPSTSGDIPVILNGKAVQWTDVEPFIDKNDRTMVPLRAVAEAMGLDVNWDPASREAIFTNGSKTIYFPIGSSTARTSGGGTVTMDTAAVIVNDRTYAPIRYLAEYFGYSVEWDAAARTVVIT